MKIFLDTEFTELTSRGELISIALVDETERIFYAEIIDYSTEKLTNWHQENVISNLFLEPGKETIGRSTLYKGNKKEFVIELKTWLNEYLESECRIIADVYMYDWVFFADLFGGALHLPRMLNFIPIDFASILYSQQIDPNINRNLISQSLNLMDSNSYISKLNQHNALYDCLLLKKNFEKIVQKIY